MSSRPLNKSLKFVTFASTIFSVILSFSNPLFKWFSKPSVIDFIIVVCICSNNMDLYPEITFSAISSICFFSALSLLIIMLLISFSIESLIYLILSYSLTFTNLLFPLHRSLLTHSETSSCSCSCDIT